MINSQQLTSDDLFSYTYDEDGNLTQIKNRLTSETKKFYYDSENRMIKYEHYPSESSPKDTTAEYSYDIFGRRLTKTVNGTTTRFLYDGTAVSYELDSNNQPKIKYFTGFRTDEYLGHLNYSEVTDWGGFIQNPMHQGGYIYFTDQVGTIEKVVKDNSTGEIKEQRTYDVFGNLINHTGENTTPIGFQSKYHDTESGLYYYYHRYYDPNTGRFITEDPIGIAGGLNLYKAFGNNPVSYVDPWGLMPPSPGYYLSGYYRYWAKVRGAIKNKWDVFSKYSGCMINCMYGIKVCDKSKKPTKVAPIPNYLIGDLSTRAAMQYEFWLLSHHPEIIELFNSSIGKVLPLINENNLLIASKTTAWLGAVVLAGQMAYCSYRCSK